MVANSGLFRPGLEALNRQAEERMVNDLISKNLVHSIHTSERRSFRGCRRRWNWIYNEYYYPKVTAKPLEFGVAFHKAMEVYYNPQTWHDRETAAALAQKAFVDTVREQYKAYLKNNMGRIDPDAKADYDERTKLGIGMLRYYTKTVSPMWDNFIPVKVEIEFEVPIKSPDGEYLWCKCTRCWKRLKASTTYREELADWEKYLKAIDELCGDTGETAEREYYKAWTGLPVTYGGRIDMLAKDEYDRYWVYDWKTAAQIAGTPLGDQGPWASDDFMLLDDQITSYCWALHSIGFPIAGFVYAQIKKAIPEEPEPLKHQRLGRWYSISKQLNTSYEMYYQTIAENDPQALAAGLYDEYLAYLKSSEGPRFHLRHEVERGEAELAEAGRNIWLEALDITDPNLRLYPSSGRFTCSTCAFQDPCLMQNRQEDFGYTLATLFEKRTKHYYETAQPSTEGKGRS